MLATLIEAIPDLDIDEGVTESVLAREQAHNTGIGKGWGCPHAPARARTASCFASIGWSPHGIDYGSPDGQPVHLVVMYLVPDTQKNAYLKEISSLAKAIQSQPELQQLQTLTELGDVRHSLLDAISIALESTAPDARARMIKLEVRQAEAAPRMNRRRLRAKFRAALRARPAWQRAPARSLARPRPRRGA